MRTILTAAAILLGTTVLAGAANAAPITFNGDFYVKSNKVDPGLVVKTKDRIDNLSFILDGAGDTYTTKLFDIWTDETDVGRDDTYGMHIATYFKFTQPEPEFDGTLKGVTEGETFWGFQWGSVDWYSPIDIAFGAKGDGILRVSLSDETFNLGLFGLTEGYKFGATVKATFTLIREATPVPEPASLALLGAGLVGIGALRRRQRVAA